MYSDDILRISIYQKLSCYWYSSKYQNKSAEWIWKR